MRNEDGTFAVGNPGGPGRPRRAIESDYLLAIAASVSLDDWKAIVLKARDDALGGDAAARNWLAKHLVGESPSLFDAVAGEAANLSAEKRIAVRGKTLAMNSMLEEVCQSLGGDNPNN